MRAVTKAMAMMALGVAGIGATSPGDPLVRTENGVLAGSRDRGIDRFLGVPYAAPPVGALRWRAPQPAARWQGIRTAIRPGADCLQDSAHNPLPAGYANAQSEDCLFLNIWRPAAPRAGRLPVMLWVHGGAYIMGSGSLPIYNGTALARKGVLVVTINYRLGRFGTFAHPALSAQYVGEPVGNYGLMDQIAALRWVQANIAAFGGDPANVTVFGESAGASAVNFLMTSPATRGLFAKAISESGGANARLKPLAGEGSLEADGARWAAAKGARDVAALRALPAETVLDAPVTVPFTPAIDGRIVLRGTTEAFRRGEAARVPYLVGANGYEESLMRWLPGAGEALLKKLGSDAGPLIEAYREVGDDPARTTARLWGEAAMVEPARRRAAHLSSAGAPVWLYRYAYVPQALRATVPGAGHDAEMEMVFATPSFASAPGWSVADQKMADAISAYWVAFAKSGDPNHPGAPEWPRFTPQQDRLMLFDSKGPHAVADFARSRLDRLKAAMTRIGE